MWQSRILQQKTYSERNRYKWSKLAQKQFLDVLRKLRYWFYLEMVLNGFLNRLTSAFFGCN